MASFFYWELSDFGELKPDKAKNAKLYVKLGSGKPAVAVKGVLEYLYKVRCNIFHGSKALEVPQMTILQPSIRCLERIVKVGMDVLLEEQQSADGV